MNDEKIRVLASKENVPIGTIEKDYAVTSVLSLIAQLSKLDKMVFKGGTAIKKVHFNDFRFSEDLDFTCSEDISEDILALLDAKKYELDFSVTDIKKETTVGNSKKFVIKYNGFNNYPNNVRIDLSLRESVQNKTRDLKVLHSYAELPSFSVPSMAIEEIMAEKVRAVIYSGAPRHLYDLNYLFGKRISLNPQLVQTKISLYGDKFSLEKFNESMLEMKKEWVQDLKPLLAQAPPSFDSVSTEVSKRVSEIMKT